MCIIEAFIVNVLKNLSRRSKYFSKNAKFENYYKIVIRAMLRKKLVLEMAGKYSDQTYVASAQQLQTHFGVSFN